MYQCYEEREGSQPICSVRRKAELTVHSSYEFRRCADRTIIEGLTIRGGGNKVHK
jgi:hypothetical protein